jgi:8-oxo-dGTP diphosphatase
MKTAVRAIVIHDQHLLVMHRNKFGREYYTLPGGGVRGGEENSAALSRELTEETSIQISAPRLVFTEAPGAPYGTQYIYLCDYQSGEPALNPGSEEAKINALGKNIYTPQWLPLSNLAESSFLSLKLRDAVVESVKTGFPEQVQAL